jgi:hypothetical protein
VIESFGGDSEGESLLGYDLRLLRKVWLRTVRAGTPPVPTSWRSLGRVGRLRWLTGRRSAEENWDAFEGVTGRPLLQLIAPPVAQPQPWSQVRFWLHDLASEIAAAEKDGTLPMVLSLDRVWITGEGRAKLLDFPAPGLASTERFNDSTIQRFNDSPDSATVPPSRPQAQSFLANVAAAALTGQPESRAEAPVPMPLHAREFLANVSKFPDTGALLAALKPLLHRVSEVSRLRRAAVVAGCLAFPVLAGVMMLLGMSFVQKWNQENPGLMELSGLLQQRTIMRRLGQTERTPSDPQYGVFIATHYHSIITNETWNSPMILAMINGDARRFAEESLAKYSAPTQSEIAAADAALKDRVKGIEFPDFVRRPQFLFFTVVGAMGIYVLIPALIAALAFRGGLVLRIANVTFARRDGERASRLRVFWRTVVAWSPLLPACLLAAAGLAQRENSMWGLVSACVVLCGLAAGSLMLRRSLPDRLAGTWPVPR